MVPPSVRIGDSLVFPVAAPTVVHIVKESVGLRHDPLEEGVERGEAGFTRTERDRSEETPVTGFKTFILLVHVSAGLLTAALAVPLIRRKVGPNALYGFRVRRTLDDPGSGTTPMRSPGDASSGPGSAPPSPASSSTGTRPSTRLSMRWHASRSCWSASPWAWHSASGTSTA